MKPLISILIPCYNAERWVALAIESALAQSWPEKEIIVVDDGSTDRSVEIIESFGNRIRWEGGPNRGATVARNRLLELANGEWLQYLDADDYLLKDKLSKHVQFLSKYPETEIIYSPFIMEYWSGTESRIETTSVPDIDDLWILLARWFLPGTGSGIWRKQSIKNVGGWDQNQPCCQEHELYLRLLIAGRKFKHHPEGGYVYRHWSENTVSKRNKPEVHRRRLKIEQRMEDFLREKGELSAERLKAINQARFEIARVAWQYDPNFAVQLMGIIRRSQQNFLPARSAAAPLQYQLVYRLLGFRTAERIADIMRNLGKKEHLEKAT